MRLPEDSYYYEPSPRVPTGPYEPYQSPPYIPPSPSDEGTFEGTYFALPYTPTTGTPVLDTGRQLVPGQSYTPGQARGVDTRRQTFGGFGGYAPAFSRGGYPAPYQSDVSYIGPTVSARPAFNLSLRGLRIKDLFKRRRIL